MLQALRVTAALSLDFESLATFTEEGAYIETFTVRLLTGSISGTAELHQGDAYIVITERPPLMTDAKARDLIVDAICKGRRLGMRPTFAKKVREASEN